MTLPVGIALVGVAMSLSWWSWRYVEVPFRRTGAQLQFPRVLARRFMVPALGLGVLAVLSVQSNGFPQRFAPEVSTLEAMTMVEPNKLRSGCHMPNARYGTEPSPNCRLGARKEQLDGIMVGDSFANHYTGMVDIPAEPNGITLMDYTLDACPVRHLMFGIDRPCSAPLDITAPYWEGIRARLTQVHFIDPNQVICPAGLCSPIIDGQLLYRDDAHLNDVGSRFIGRTLRNRGFSLLHDPAQSGPIATAR